MTDSVLNFDSMRWTEKHRIKIQEEVSKLETAREAFDCILIKEK